MLGRKRRREEVGGGGEGRYRAKARVMEKEYCLKSLIVASLVEKFRRTGGHGDRRLFFGNARLLRGRERLWKAD